MTQAKIQNSASKDKHEITLFDDLVNSHRTPTKTEVRVAILLISVGRRIKNDTDI